jgi:hypothetical protein
MDRGPANGMSGARLERENRFTLRELIDEAKREASMRRNVYAKQVIAGRMTQGQADRNIAMMDAIARRLSDLARDP